jgi:hypothetical protein
MFCPQCGSQMTANAAFCPNCGTALNTNQTPSNTQPAPVQAAVQAPVVPAAPVTPVAAPVYQVPMRETEIRLLQGTVDYFAQKIDLYREYDRVSDQVKEDADAPGAGYIVWGVILSLIGLFLTSLGLADSATEAASPLIGIGGVIMLLAIGLIVIRAVKGTKKSNTYDKSVSRYWNIYNELYAHYIGFPNCPVSMEYTHPEILAVVLRNLQTGRNDNIQGALLRAIDDADDDDIEDYMDDLSDAVFKKSGGKSKALPLFCVSKLFK